MTVEKARPAGGCGCGGCGNPSEVAAGPYTYVRPRFFAGQLLTEEDLEGLVAYTGAKHRLHNRYLFGAGVVCGLEVACDPCGGGTVRVAPGYALDCCGSDIVVPSPVRVDVNALVRELLRAGLGVDCGDPCTTSPGTSRRYYLYIRYAETPADPVTPYVTDEPCGQQGCEPSRVREGFSFVLRSERSGDPHDDITTRAAACDPPAQPKQAAGIERLTGYTRSMLLAARPGPEAAFDLDAVAAAAARLPAGPAAAAPTANEARALAEAVLALAGELARLQLQDEGTRTAIVNDPQATAKITAARDSLGAAVTTLSGAPDQEAAGDLLTQAGALADPKAPPLTPVQARMLAQGLPLSAGVLSELQDTGTDLRAWLLARLDRATGLTDCRLRAEVAALRLPAGEGLDEPAVARVADANEELLRLVARYQRACRCAALLPPCPACLDTDVLLAAIDVLDCEVTTICNLVRDLVISPAALRYWVPQLRTLQDELARSCCDDTGRGARGERGPAWPAVFDVRDLFPEPPAGPPPEPPAADTAAADEVTALRAQVDELSRLLTETGDKLMIEKGRITKLQNHVNRLPRR